MEFKNEILEGVLETKSAAVDLSYSQINTSVCANMQYFSSSSVCPIRLMEGTIAV